MEMLGCGIEGVGGLRLLEREESFGLHLTLAAVFELAYAYSPYTKI